MDKHKNKEQDPTSDRDANIDRDEKKPEVKEPDGPIPPNEEPNKDPHIDFPSYPPPSPPFPPNQ